MRRETEDRISIHKHYIVIDAGDIESLMMDVNDVVATGEWAIAGGVSQANHDGKQRYIQALTRLKNTPWHV